MIKFKLTIAYDGTAFKGWQRQPSERTVQNYIESALKRIFNLDLPVESSSRTDAGVHAYGMVAHFSMPRGAMKMPHRHLILSLNACLPEDIRVRSAVCVPLKFHARFDATGKQYRYLIWNHPAMNPLLRHRAWHVPTSLNLAKMRNAAMTLVGTHDFRAFTVNRGFPLENSIRTLARCEIRKEGPLLTLLIEGDGFLYKMCRGIAGTLVQIGSGRLLPEAVPSMLASREDASSGMNAPAHGLILHRVFYRSKPQRKAPDSFEKSGALS